ncbi:hypothetical protein [Enterovirga rhinocerotis]|nr:hypothetical protein [Enterovirga rhinocerotis]
MLAAVLALWIVFGISRGEATIFLTNGPGLAPTLAVIGDKLRFNRPKANP